MVYVDQVYLRVTYLPSTIAITDIEDENFVQGQTAVTITGKSFGSAAGTGIVELAISTCTSTLSASIP